MTQEQAKKFKYWQYRTIGATMIGYALFYFVRKNFSFAIPGLAAEYGISNTSFGIIMTVVGLTLPERIVGRPYEWSLPYVYRLAALRIGELRIRLQPHDSGH